MDLLLNMIIKEKDPSSSFKEKLKEVSAKDVSIRIAKLIPLAQVSEFELSLGYTARQRAE